jgi:cytochrome c5
MRGGFKVFVSGAGLVAMTFAGASAASAQEPAPTPAAQQPPAAPAEPEKPVFTFPQACQTCDVALITVFIKPDKTADFDMVLEKVKESLAKSENAERKQQAAGWTVFKSPTAVQGNAVYIMRLDPIVKGAEYDLMRIIAEVFPVEVQEIFAKYKDAFAGRGVTEMSKFITMQD